MILHPLAYSLIVVPFTVPRWLQFNFHEVSPATVFFGFTMFNLSGAINVVLFLIARPRLLLFPQLARQGTGSAIFSDLAKF
ncbi:hypothetical protein BGY98DRAFT_1036899 [Russula aff. rugulosa BPL654]|nr:hypothetical protein BGY98DRAFT_1036899 [Russula aff. rugulosa BPL654]